MKDVNNNMGCEAERPGGLVDLGATAPPLDLHI